MSDATKIPILIVADCEPDPREPVPGQPEPWVGFERFFALMSEFRPRFLERTGVPPRFSWFWRLDRSIAVIYGNADWAVRRYADQIAEAKRQGDEIGAHVHPLRWDGAMRRWIADFGNPVWVEGCLRDALAEYGRVFGEPCRIFSFGDGWHSQETIALVEQLGVQIDMTLEPGYAREEGRAPGELSTGLLTDRRGMPCRPYRPSRQNYLEPDREGRTRLWVLPMTTGPRGDHKVSLLARLRGERAPVEKINIGHEPERFMPMFESALSGTRPYVTIAVRTDVGRHEGLLRHTEHNLRSILAHPRVECFAFTGPTATLHALNG